MSQEDDLLGIIRRMGRKAVERVAIEPRSPWWGEHRSRYRFASQFADGMRVLDIACGTGFGCQILEAGGASLVVGIDIHIAPNDIGRSDQVQLCIGDGTRLPVQSSSFDLVTSFETVEHIGDAPTFLDEIQRVLRSSGVFVVSTPNALHSPKVDGRPANPFHVREYRPHELKQELESRFSEVLLLGQKTSRRYPISPFWESDDVMGRKPATHARILVWKLQNRLPFALKNGWSRLLHSRPFFPGETDFDFSEEHVRTGHVLVAVCRRPLEFQGPM